MFKSSVSYGGKVDDDGADYVYYNADIINNTTADLNLSGLATPDPQIRFNETRETALIKDASQYDFSIVRFSMDGPGLDLPVLIPTIELGQPDVNLTTYKVGFAYEQLFSTPIGNVQFYITSDAVPVIYVPENRNPIIAPIPAPPITVQDVTSRYYFVSTYTSFVAMVNRAMVTAYFDLYTKFKAQWDANPLYGPFPFTGYSSGAVSWTSVVQVPELLFNSDTKKFSIIADSDGFGTGIQPGQEVPNGPILPFTPISPGPLSFPTMRLFFNTNLYGLLSNFYATYYNTTKIANYPNQVPAGFTYEILFYDSFYQNLLDYRQPPYSTPAGQPQVPIKDQGLYYKMTQDAMSIDQLWSPCSSIVFCSALLPVKYEYVGVPNILGTGNLNGIDGVSQSAFQPIITDVAVDTTSQGASAYRGFTYYTPVAEYRMSDFGRSKTDIRQIDIQVYWKNRLTGGLIPLTMYNLSSVSLKLMFRHKRISGGKGG